jgi:hypothetical protein
LLPDELITLWEYTAITSQETGLVSPIFHCLYDDLFETMTGTQARSNSKILMAIQGRVLEGYDKRRGKEQ